MQHIQSVSYTFNINSRNNYITVFIHKNGTTFSIADIEIGQYDIITESDYDYLQSVAENVAFDMGYNWR
ncbi:MAG: hypothetical protein KBT27_12895 [Prevotellaceae bacterium]|nr:hypothetical protein [Candidatus Faecinaster equi]